MSALTTEARRARRRVSEPQRHKVHEERNTERRKSAAGRALNRTTERTLDATDAGRDLVVCKDADDMFRKLGVKAPKEARK